MARGDDVTGSGRGVIRTGLRFVRLLRAAGLSVSVGQLEAFLRAFEWLDPLRRADVYYAASAALLGRREDRALFDRVFEAFWLGASAAEARGQPMPLAPR